MADGRMVYVAGPITGDPFGCVRTACAAFTELRNEGLVPFLPQLAVLAEMVEHRSYGDWLAYDFDVIRHCAALVRLPGESPGADKEAEFARSLGIPVFVLPGGWPDLREWAAARPDREPLWRGETQPPPRPRTNYVGEPVTGSFILVELDDTPPGTAVRVDKDTT